MGVTQRWGYNALEQAHMQPLSDKIGTHSLQLRVELCLELRNLAPHMDGTLEFIFNIISCIIRFE